MNISPDKNIDQKEFIALLRNPDKKAMSIIYDRFSPILYGFALKIAGTEDFAANVLEKTFIFINSNKALYDESKQSPILWMIGIVRMVYLQSNLNIIKKQNQAPEFYVDINNGTAKSKTLNTESAFVISMNLEHKMILDQIFGGKNINDIAASLGKNAVEVKKMLREAVNSYRKTSELKWK